MKGQIWVVERKAARKGSRWYPCRAVGLTKSDAEAEKESWQRGNPDDFYRTTKYVPAK